MKRIILTVICILIVAFTFSEETEINSKKQIIYTGVLSPGIFSTFGLGMGQISSNRKTESVVIFQVGAAPMFLGGGIYSQKRFFKNTTRTGMFYTFDIGVDIILGAVGDPGGGSAGFAAIPFPNFAGGIGYSKKIAENSYLRISLDLGIKALLSNLNLSITF